MIFTHGKETIMRKQLIASLVSLSLVTSSVLVSPVAHASGAVAGMATGGGPLSPHFSKHEPGS